MNLGKKIKIRDMRPGWTYTAPDKTIEEMFQEKHGYWPPAGMQDVVPNTGLFLKKNKELKYDKYDFDLYLVQETDELTDKPLRPGQSGTVQIIKTGRKIWLYHPNYYVRIEANSLDFEMEEAHPFPVALIREGCEAIPLPDPWEWKMESAGEDSKDYVQVWDESDAKVLITLGIFSFLFLLAGLSGLGLLGTMWIWAILYFRSKHKKTKERILAERRKAGVRGGGLDHKFKW